MIPEKIPSEAEDEISKVVLAEVMPKMSKREEILVVKQSQNDEV